jgi:hypothetical protein
VPPGQQIFEDFQPENQALFCGKNSANGTFKFAVINGKFQFK